jgi:RNA polymerase sigma-70 factor (ECF subfamily)
MSAHEPGLALEAHRRSLTAHCYRMLGSIADADDAVQETLLRAFRRSDQFEGRARLRTWLHAIATRVCLDSLRSGARRARPFEERPVGAIDSPLLTRPAEAWLEPAPDAAVWARDDDPAVARESIRLAFVAALQVLPPRQRAALLLADVIEFSAAEIGEALETPVAGVNSLLQRARETLRRRPVEPAPGALGEGQRRMLERYAACFERYDVQGLVALLAEDVRMNMPPFDLWLQGRESVAGWLLGRGIGCRGSRLVPTAANGAPAFGQYRIGEDAGTWTPWSLTVLELRGDEIGTWTAFLDVGTLFPRFGLPPKLEA